MGSRKYGGAETSEQGPWTRSSLGAEPDHFTSGALAGAMSKAA